MQEHFVLSDCWNIIEDVTVWAGVTDGAFA